MITYLRPKFDKFVEKSVNRIPFLIKIHPDVLSLMTVFAACITAGLFISGNYLWALASFILGFVDGIDGAVARATKTSSAWGGFLDATLDRVTETIIAFSLGLSGLISWPICFLGITTSLLVSYLKAKAEAGLGIDKVGTNNLSVGLVQRLERPIFIAGGVLVYVFVYQGTFLGYNAVELVTILLIVLTVMTFGMRMRVAYQLFKEKKNKS
ncbi:MAG: CDP-alcohol phosphatidyltransferase family protein [Candidatus Dojkabacteria bacterium]